MNMHICDTVVKSARKTIQHQYDTTELYLNFIQVHCLYRIYLQYVKSGQGEKKRKIKRKKKKPLDTTEVLAKSIYKVCHFLVNMNQDKQRCSVVCFIKHLFFFNISQHEVGEQCLNSCKNKCLITRLGNIVCNGHTRTLLFHCQNSIEGESKKEKKLTKP